MKKIINGKMYDTDTAKELGSWSNGYSTNDFNFVNETLYRKRTGEFFLCGEGGAMTKYSTRTGDSWSSGKEIIPLNYEKAQEWAESNLDADEYEQIFGAIAEDDSKTTICVSISVQTAEKIKRAAAKSGMTISEYIESKLQGDN